MKVFLSISIIILFLSTSLCMASTNVGVSYPKDIPSLKGLSDSKADPGEQAPDFTVPAYYDGIFTPDTFTLYDYWGSIILITFWEIW